MLAQTFPSGLFFMCKPEGCRQPRALLSHPLYLPHQQQDLSPLPTAWFSSQSYLQAELGGGGGEGGSSSPSQGAAGGSRAGPKTPLCVLLPSPCLPLSQLGPSEIAPLAFGIRVSARQMPLYQLWYFGQSPPKMVLWAIPPQIVLWAIPAGDEEVLRPMW